ncbi:hypothetical protein PG995_015235 [Apiospora arundinis]
MLSPEQKSRVNLDLWLQAMDFSQIRQLYIHDFRGPPELLTRLAPSLPSLQFLGVEGKGLGPLVDALPNRSLQHLFYIDPGPAHDLDQILATQGDSLKTLQWYTTEHWIPMLRPVLSPLQLRELRTSAPNLQSLAIDLNRDNTTWPWDHLEALRDGMPAGLERLTIYFDEMSECRRQHHSVWEMYGDEPCPPNEREPHPTLTTETAHEVAAFLLGDVQKASVLAHISFRTDYEDGLIPDSLLSGLPEYERQSSKSIQCSVFKGPNDVQCTVLNGAEDVHSVDGYITDFNRNVYYPNTRLR